MTLAEALRAKILTLSAATAITELIRSQKLMQKDRLPAIVISVEEEEGQVDFSGTGGLTDATVAITAMAATDVQAQALATAIRTNNTNPGTGLEGFSGQAGTIEVDITYNRDVSGWVPLKEGKDEGISYVDSMYTVWYTRAV